MHSKGLINPKNSLIDKTPKRDGHYRGGPTVASTLLNRAGGLIWMGFDIGANGSLSLPDLLGKLNP